MRRWIVDASPLILLHRIGRGDLLLSLSPSLLIPQEVAAEVTAGPRLDPARVWLLSYGTQHIVEGPISVHRVASLNLGAGESAVLAHALALEGVEAILDDGRARRAARALGVPTRGTIGIVALAKLEGLVPQASPLLGSLIDSGMRIDRQLLGAVCQRLGEPVP